MICPLADALGELADRISQAPRVLLCLDFDGTLAPIVEHPGLASLSQETRQAVLALAQDERFIVAIISGRDRTDLQSRVRISDVFYAGNHGLEISGPGCLFVELTAAGHTELLHCVAEDLSRNLQRVRSAFVEDKGLTLSVHFRQVAGAQHEEVRRIVLTTLASWGPHFVMTSGHMVFEIRPRTCWNKASAVDWIKQQLGKEDIQVIFIGDDVTDENAFAALTDEITIRVGSPLDTQAQFWVEDTEDVREFLEWLAITSGSVVQPESQTLGQLANMP